MIVFVQSTPSQLDAPFYRKLAEHLGSRAQVLIWNEYGLKRETLDPELGVVPAFPDVHYPAQWVDRRGGLLALWKAIRACKPRKVVLQDQTWGERITLSLLLRICSIRVGVRSDKNALSDGARGPIGRRLEGRIIRACFDFLVPVSALTRDYYGWPVNRACITLPYCSDDDKFSTASARADAVRAKLRSGWRVPADAPVFLAVVKFSEREDPRAVITSFYHSWQRHPRSWLVMVGAGPLLEREKRFVADSEIGNVVFAGYVPYARLEEYFFAADVLVHLPRAGPWEISVPDALLAGMGVIASNVVGSAVVLLQGGLARFLVACGDTEAAGVRMDELCSMSDVRECFGSARERVQSSFTVSSVAASWADWLLASERGARAASA
jgi:glycosyltransferase involved in cell wall biosynthesis